MRTKKSGRTLRVLESVTRQEPSRVAGFWSGLWVKVLAEKRDNGINDRVLRQY
jgi:hypothetical protein